MYTQFKRCYLCITFRSWIMVTMCSRTFAQKMALIKWMLASPCDRQDSQRKWRKRGCRSRSVRPFWSGIWNVYNFFLAHSVYTKCTNTMCGQCAEFCKAKIMVHIGTTVFWAQVVIRCVGCIVWLRRRLKSNTVMMSGKGLNMLCRYNRGV